MLAERGVAAEVFSVTSYNELARDLHDAQRWNLLHPDAPPRRSHVSQVLEGDAPVVAASDYQKSLAEQIRGGLSAPFTVLGADGFGRSDTRDQLRSFFEVDRRFVALAALGALAQAQRLPAARALEAREAFGIDPNRPNPRLS